MNGNLGDVAEAGAERGEDLRARIIAAAAALLSAGGQDAVTTRAVAAASKAQPPAIYRLFGDKHGLLDAVAEHGLAAYMAEKGGREPHPDPVQDLRDSWDIHIAFGVGNPGLFAIMIDDDHAKSTAVRAGMYILRAKVRRIALAGRLRVTEERAVALLRSMGNGTVLTLLGEEEGHRDAGLSAAAREAVILAIVTDRPVVGATGPAAAATALRAALPTDNALTENERKLMAEWLERIVTAR